MESEGDRRQARAYFLKALEGFNKVVSTEPNNLQALRDLVLPNDKLAGLAIADGDAKQARDYLAKSLEITKKIVALGRAILKSCAT